MIKQVTLPNDEVLFELFKTNDKEFGSGRAKLVLKKTAESFTVELQAKDSGAMKALEVSVNNTVKVHEKVKEWMKTK